MTTIERIEKVFAALQAVKEAGGVAPSARVEDVTMPDLLEVCEHYGTKPSRSTWWTTGIHRDEVIITVFSDRIVPTLSDPTDLLSELRNEVASRTNNAAA